MKPVSFNFKKCIWYFLLLFYCFQNLQATNNQQTANKGKGLSRFKKGLNKQISISNLAKKKLQTTPSPTKKSPSKNSTDEEPKIEEAYLAERKNFEDGIENNPHLKDSKINTLYIQYKQKRADGLNATQQYFAALNKKPTSSTAKPTSSQTSSSSLSRSATSYSLKPNSSFSKPQNKPLNTGIKARSNSLGIKKSSVADLVKKYETGRLDN